MVKACRSPQDHVSIFCSTAAPQHNGKVNLRALRIRLCQHRLNKENISEQYQYSNLLVQIFLHPKLKKNLNLAVAHLSFLNYMNLSHIVQWKKQTNVQQLALYLVQNLTFQMLLKKVREKVQSQSRSHANLLYSTSEKVRSSLIQPIT